MIYIPGMRMIVANVEIYYLYVLLHLKLLSSFNIVYIQSPNNELLQFYLELVTCDLSSTVL